MRHRSVAHFLPYKSLANVLRTRPLVIDVCERSALDGFWVQTCFLKSVHSVLVVLTTKSTKN